MMQKPNDNKMWLGVLFAFLILGAFVVGWIVLAAYAVPPSQNLSNLSPAPACSERLAVTGSDPHIASQSLALVVAPTCASLAVIEIGDPPIDFESTLPFVKAYLKTFPLSKFNYTVFPFPLSDPASDQCSDWEMWYADVLGPALLGLQNKVTQYAQQGYKYIGLPSYSPVLRPFLLGTEDYYCIKGKFDSNKLTKQTIYFFDKKNINERFPTLQFIVYNPGTGAVDAVQNIVRFSDVNSLADDSVIQGNLALGFKLDSLTTAANSPLYKFITIAQSNDAVSIEIADYVANFALSQAIATTQYTIDYVAPSFVDAQYITLINAITTASLAVGNTGRVLVGISVNGGLADEFSTGGNTNGFFTAINNLGNVAILGLNYAPLTVTVPTDIVIGLDIGSPDITSEAIFAGFPASPFLSHDGDIAYLDFIKWASKCYTIPSLPVLRPYTAGGNEMRFIGNTIVSQWLQFIVIEANTLQSKTPDRGYQLNGFWWGASQAVPY